MVQLLALRYSIDAYREAAKRSGFDPSELPIATAGFFYAAETTQQAQREAYPHINQGMQLINGQRLSEATICTRCRYT